jgi:hypothetical protein
MAHYAFINENNVVVEVIVGKDEGDMGIDWETHYGEFRGLQCKRTSYNTLGNVHTTGGIPFRKNYAGIGFTYDPIKDAFIPPKPFDSWTLNSDSCLWEPPIPYPEDNNVYTWNEIMTRWDRINT